MLLHMFSITYCIYRRTWWFQLMIGCHQHYVITLLFGTLCCAVTIIDWLSMQPSPIIVLQLQVLLWLSSCPLKKMQASIISFSRQLFSQNPWWNFSYFFTKNHDGFFLKNSYFLKTKIMVLWKISYFLKTKIMVFNKNFSIFQYHLTL